MDAFKYLQRQLNRLKIDLLTQRTFLAGGIPSIDDDNIIKTVSSNYEEVEIIFFDRYHVKPDDIIVDVGCGKARVFGYLLYKGLKNKMLGYEINQEVAGKTKKRLARWKNVEIRSENIFDHFPEKGNVFYLYHPFKEAMMTQFREEFLKIADRDPVMLYNNAVHANLFQNDQFNCEVLDVAIPRYNYTFKFAMISIKKA
jgi:SAM-dependent methyltransferase